MIAWRTHPRKPLILFVLAALFIYTFDCLTLRFHPFQQEHGSDSLLSTAVMIDFIVIVPLLFYLLVARRQHTPHTASPLAATVPWAALGAAITWLTLQGSMPASIWTIELILLPAEALFIGLELRLAVTVYRKLRKRQAESGQPFPEALAAVLGPGKLKAYIRHDLSVLYYLIGSWKATKLTSRTGAQIFTYHRTTGLLVTIALLTKILLFEAVVVHLFIRMWSETLAWIATCATAWLLALLWADYRRSTLEPIRLTAHGAVIRQGLRLQAEIPYSIIAEVRSGMELKPAQHERRSSVEPALGTANVCIALREPAAVEELLFQPRKVSYIYLAVDDPEAFAAACRKQQQANSI